MKLTDFEEIIDDNYMDTKLFSSTASKALNNNDNNDNNDNKVEEDIDKTYSSIIYKDKDEFIVVEKSDCSNIQLGVWDNIKKKSSELKNIFIFNYLTGENKLNLPIKNKKVQIFSYKNCSDNEYINMLSNLCWFSYRNDILTIFDKGNKITSDAGWGCMIRAFQMIIAQAIYRLFNIKSLDIFLNNFIYLFLDVKIPKKYLNKNLGMKESEINMSFSNISISDILNSNNNLNNKIIYGFEEIIEKKGSKDYYIPPFSLYYMSQKNYNKDKGPGNYFSNYDIINIFDNIYNIYHPFNYFNSELGIEFFNFSTGIIYINDILKTCFELVECSCAQKNFIDIEEDGKEKKNNDINNNNIINNSININCNCFKDCFGVETKKKIVNENDFEIFEEEQKIKFYKMKKKFILFISVRHGLYTIDKLHRQTVLNIFDCPNNIGIIGGKNKRAFYFVGKCEDDIIFLDPHFVQNNIDFEKFIKEGKDRYTFQPNDIYYMNIKELGASFSIGYVFNKGEEFVDFISKYSDVTFEDNQIKRCTLVNEIDNFFVIKLENKFYPKNIESRVIYIK